MRLVEGPSGITLSLTDDPPVNRFKPSVDYLFFSALKVKSKKIVAVLLTGMGADGALGMVELKRENVYTIAQDEDSSVVYGMPRAAFEMGGVSLVASLKDMPNAVLRAVSR